VDLESIQVLLSFFFIGAFVALIFLYWKERVRSHRLKLNNLELFKENIKFNHIFEDNINPVLVLDHNLQVVRVNKAYLNYFDESIDAFVNNLKEINGDELIYDVIGKMKAKKEVKFSFKTLHGDNEKHFECYLTPFFDESELYYLGNFIDKTDSVIKNQQLEKITQQAIGLAKKKSEFMASVSHELRTPLNGIIGLSDSLGDFVADQSNKEMIHVIHESGLHLLQLINNILDFSKLEADKVDLENIPVALEDLSQSVYSTLSEVAKKKGIELKINIDDKLPNNLMMDKLRITQVLFNLVGNSIKFTDEGSVTLSIIQMNKKNNKHNVQFSIKDTGIGMDKDGLNNLFQAFSQADTTIARKYGGTGLGLSISKKIIDLYNSQIHVESELGKGSHFFFEIELNEAQNAKVIQEEVFEFNGNDIPLKILIAEDNKVNQLVARKYFNKIGYNDIEFADNGKIAFEKANAHSYDVIFMDMQMPEVDGVTATKMIFDQMDFFDAPIIIAMTANSDKEDRKKCLDAGMSDFITKPLNTNDIKKVILKHFSQLKKSA
jgi:CheY-like chemotaxis protein/nitrogen-specific signal transduction histidine kinase